MSRTYAGMNDQMVAVLMRLAVSEAGSELSDRAWSQVAQFIQTVAGQVYCHNRRGKSRINMDYHDFVGSAPGLVYEAYTCASRQQQAKAAGHIENWIRVVLANALTDLYRSSRRRSEERLLDYWNRRMSDEQFCRKYKLSPEQYKALARRLPDAPAQSCTENGVDQRDEIEPYLRLIGDDLAGMRSPAHVRLLVEEFGLRAWLGDSIPPDSSTCRPMTAANKYQVISRFCRRMRLAGGRLAAA